MVPDCLKSAVSRACRYEPEINPTYADMASHYGICVIPARPARPKDKAKVENGVLIAKRWILAVLRHRTFYALADLNTAMGDLLERLNNRPLRKLKQSRRELFSLFDQPNALPLPHKPYEYAEWKIPIVNIDYHIEVDDHYYSVPHELKGKTRSPAHGPYGRSLFERPARGQPCPKLCAPSSHHGQRTYAARSPAVF